MSTLKKVFSLLVVPALIALLGGILLGGVGFLLSKIIPLLLVVPVLMGLVVGSVLKAVFANSTSVSKIFMIVAVFLMSVVSYGTLNYAKYQDFKQNIEEHVLSENAPRFLSKIVKAVGVPLVDDYFEMKTGHSGFAGYMIYSAEEPIEVGFGKVLEMGVVVAWIIRMIELALIIFIGFFLVQPRKK